MTSDCVVVIQFLKNVLPYTLTNHSVLICVLALL